MDQTDQEMGQNGLEKGLKWTTPFQSFFLNFAPVESYESSYKDFCVHEQLVFC